MTLVSGYLSLGGILKDGAASDGTAGQVLTSTGTATSWVDQSTIVGAPNTLTEVLTAGNIATDLNITLNGTGAIAVAAASIFSGGITVGTGASSFTGTVGFNDNISTSADLSVLAGMRDGSSSLGTAGQVLSSTGTGVSWIPASSIGATLTQVLTAGNTANNLDLLLTGTGRFSSVATNNGFGAILVGPGPSAFSGTCEFNADCTTTADLKVGGGMRDGALSLGVAGQVLSSTGTAVEWIDSASIGTLTQVLTAGNTANNLSINLTGSGAITTAGVSNFTGDMDNRISKASDELLRYDGGPQSFLGLAGETGIRIARDYNDAKKNRL